MKRLIFFFAAALGASAAMAALVKLAPQHGISKAFLLKTDGDVEYTVRFYRPDVFRVEAAPKAWEGEGTNRTYTVDYTDHLNNPAKAQMLVDGYAEDTTLVKFADRDGKFSFTTTEIIVEFDKTNETMSVWNWDRDRTGEQKPVIAEVAPLAFTTNSCVQTLASDANVRYYGGGQQVGRLMHKGRKILIDCDFNWAEGGVPNPVPLVLSSEGYGVFRHTYSAGEYDFTATNSCALKHDEARFDAFYFIGDFATVIDRYTEMTGRPNMLPMWGLELGDADAYMTRERDTKDPKQEKDGSFTETTPDVAKIAAKYREHDMPGSWILVNDGYGSGYTMLGGVADVLAQYGFKTGLWTEGELDLIAWEVGTAGTRVQKLDVAWTGRGGDYKMQHAMQCNKDAYLGMTTNSDARAFIWSVLGWAGSQRYGIAWAGDEYGGWDLIRYMIPGITGSAMSAQAYATADVDGIFGGSNETYLRDLQWKCWTTAMYVMNGWSHINKGPWSYPEPYRSLIRTALKEKIRYTPYFYAYMREALDHGTPIIRPMVWNWPDDPETWGEKTKYQFMAGDSILVAPVYSSMKFNRGWWRKGIYLPAGEWYDLNDGRRVKGGQWLKSYPIDLTKIPVFVRAGAIIPKYDSALTTMVLDRTRMTFDIWPSTNGGCFRTYEDDGETRAYEDGAYECYAVACSGNASAETIADQRIALRPVPTDGYRAYTGRPDRRIFEFDIHLQSQEKPVAVVCAGRELIEIATTNCVSKMYANVAEGWYYDAEEKFGTLHVKMRPCELADDAEIVIDIRFARESVARTVTPDYPQPSEEEAEAADTANVCKAVNMPLLNNTNVRKYADGDDMVQKAGDKDIIIDRLDGTYTRVTGHVATHKDNSPDARFTFAIYSNGSKKMFERTNMKGDDVPQLIAVDIPSGTGWLTLKFTADDGSEASKSAKGVWKNVELRAE